jgi:hypothetical protein
VILLNFTKGLHEFSQVALLTAIPSQCMIRSAPTEPCQARPGLPETGAAEGTGMSLLVIYARSLHCESALLRHPTRRTK